jgi:transposase
LRGDRLFVEAVTFRAKTGLQWRDLPARFGPWKSVYNRFSNWAKKGHWATIFRELQFEVDETGSIVDPTRPNSNQPDLTKVAESARESVQAPEVPGLSDVFDSRRLHLVFLS